MVDSLIEQLPRIMKQGRREAEKTLEGLSKPNRVTLQTNELVLPTKAVGGTGFGQKAGIESSQEWYNRLIYGDNLLVMQALLAGDTTIPSLRGAIDLIYIDPPFDSKANYRTKIHLPSIDLEQKPAVIEQFAYSDTWKNGTTSYLEMIIPRLILMRELLSEQGSIYVHMDYHVGHFINVIMDDIFGAENFKNEIVWKRSHARSSISKIFRRAHDRIFLYSKNDNAIFNTQYGELSEGSMKLYSNKDDRGTYQLVPVLVSGIRRGETGQPWHGIDPSILGKNGMHWVTKPEKLKVYEKDGLIAWPKKKGGLPRLKYYLEENKGVPISDLWVDTGIIESSSNESLDFPTQKPESLIERIIKTSSNEGGLVADFFAGSGTTGAVAEKLSRRWIMVDLGKPACMMTRKRLIDQEAKTFLYQSVGDYQKEQFERSSYKQLGNLSQVIINLYGARPFVNSSSYNNLGYMKQTKTLVYVDSPNKITGYPTLIKAQELRNSFMGSWNRVVVLGWNFSNDIAEVKRSLNDDRLEVLVIPPDLLDRLKTKAKASELIKSGTVRFSSLQYLTIKPIKKSAYNDELDEYRVELYNYVLLSPDALPLEEDQKNILQKIIAKDPLSLIEYWSIDPDYDNQLFRSRWQEYRGNIESDSDPYRVTRTAKLLLPKKETPRTFCVKVVDVFGFEAATIQKVV